MPTLPSLVRRGALAVLVIASVAGCATLARQAFANPVVTVRDVRVKNIGLAGGTLEVFLDVQNPNEYRLDASRIRYTFLVDTNEIVNGEITELLTLEEKGTTQLTVPVNFGYREMGIAMREYTAKGALDYTVRGDFTLKTPFGSLTRPFSGRGRVQGLP